MKYGCCTVTLVHSTQVQLLINTLGGRTLPEGSTLPREHTGLFMLPVFPLVLLLLAAQNGNELDVSVHIVQ